MCPGQTHSAGGEERGISAVDNGRRGGHPAVVPWRSPPVHRPSSVGPPPQCPSSTAVHRRAGVESVRPGGRRLLAQACHIWSNQTITDSLARAPAVVDDDRSGVRKALATTIGELSTCVDKTVDACLERQIMSFVRLGDGRGSALRLLIPDPGRQLRDLVVDVATLGHERADLAVCMHDGRVVATAEDLSDLRQGQIGQFPA